MIATPGQALQESFGQFLGTDLSKVVTVSAEKVKTQSRVAPERVAAIAQSCRNRHSRISPEYASVPASSASANGKTSHGNVASFRGQFGAQKRSASKAAVIGYFDTRMQFEARTAPPGIVPALSRCLDL